MEKDDTEPRIIDIMLRFTENIRELRVLNEEIGELAEAYDQAAFADYFNVVTNVLGIPELESKHVEKIRNQWEGISERKYKERIEKDKKLNIHKIINAEGSIIDERIVDAFVRMHRSSPTQGKLIRRSALVLLISYFELFISDIIQAYYLRYPDALPSEQKSLSLHDLRIIGSIKDAEYLLIMKEVDLVLRGTLEQQIQYISSKMHFNINYLDDYQSKLIEISQRRNIIVHNGSVVNQVYFKNVDADLISKYCIELGDKIDVSKEYLSDAIDIFYICGFILVQQCLRKWDKLHEYADSIICKHTYNELREERYNLVVYLSEFSSKIKIGSDYYCRKIAINHAIALNELGEYGKVEIILSKYDWSACAIRFLLALHILKGEEEKLFQLLPRAIAAGEIDKVTLEEWPLFKKFRGTARFQAVVDSCPLPSSEPEESGGEESS
jgi:hypothetical protein